MPFTYEYPRPMLTADVVCLRLRDRMEVLLIRRGRDPFAGKWALPGGFVEMDEEVEDAARRELAEETGLEAGRLLELGTFSRVGRDPRGRVVSVVFVAPFAPEAGGEKAGDDAAGASWFPLFSPPPVAFDHGEILDRARAFLRERAGDLELTRALLGEPPDAPELARLFRACGVKLDEEELRRALGASPRGLVMVGPEERAVHHE